MAGIHTRWDDAYLVGIHFVKPFQLGLFSKRGSYDPVHSLDHPCVHLPVGIPLPFSSSYRATRFFISPSVWNIWTMGVLPPQVR